MLDVRLHDERWSIRLPHTGYAGLVRDPDDDGIGRAVVRIALGLYVAQLALNLAWSWLFFAARSPGWALVDIAVLAVLVAATMVVFWRVEPVAGWLLVPYLVWVVFAASLNAWIVLRN